MIILAYLIGLSCPGLVGYLLLLNLERGRQVLRKPERAVIGCLIGLTLSMLMTFCAHVGAGAPLNLWTFLSVQAAAAAILGILLYALPPRALPPHPLALSGPSKQWMTWAAWGLGIWTLAKILLAAVTFLLLTPTYLDDTIDNWNLRGKVFFVDQALTLAMPGEDPMTSPLGVSSYPPTVPLAKVWMAHLGGGWSDPVVNLIHVVWYLLAIALVFIVLRRTVSLWWSLIGAYLLTSLPLYLMHGTNTYGDIFLSAHVFLAVGMAYLGVTTDDAQTRASYLRIGGVAAGLLAFTKNEGLLIFLPPLLLVVGICLLLRYRRREITGRELLTPLLWYGGAILLIGLPWLAFKWANGLTFGNAKPFTSLGIKWQENVLLSVSVNTFLEGNWLLLFPALFILIPLQKKESFGHALPLTLFFLIVYLGQMALYLFTGLSTEALRQTGYARGLVHLAPIAVTLTTLLLQRMFGRVSP